MADRRIPAAPAGLGTAGRRLWREVLADNDLRPDEAALLAQACGTLDLVGRLSSALAGQELLTPGSTGQARANPLLGELRAQRACLARLLGQLAVPDEDVDAPVTAASRRASRAANARWRRSDRERVVLGLPTSTDRGRGA